LIVPHLGCWVTGMLPKKRADMFVFILRNPDVMMLL